MRACVCKSLTSLAVSWFGKGIVFVLVRHLTGSEIFGPVLVSTGPCIFSWVSLSWSFVKLYYLFLGFLLSHFLGWGGVRGKDICLGNTLSHVRGPILCEQFGAFYWGSGSGHLTLQVSSISHTLWKPSHLASALSPLAGSRTHCLVFKVMFHLIQG